MGNLNLKTFAMSLGLVGASLGTPQAATIVYDNALRDINNDSCNFTRSCVVALTGSDAAAGTIMSEGITQNGTLGDLFPNDGDFFELSIDAFGLGLGFLKNSNLPNTSRFLAVLTLSVDRDVTWTGGAFTSVQVLDPQLEDENSSTTQAVTVLGPGFNTTIFENEANFNTAPGNQTQGTDGFEPREFTLDGLGITFLAGETYTLAFRDFANAGDGNEALVQQNNMNFVTTASIPLPATAWMMISALGFLGWRKYRAA